MRTELTSVRIRQAGHEDLEGAIQLFKRLDRIERGWRVFAPRSPGFAATRAKYRRLIGSEDGIVVVAESVGALVGLGVGEVTRPSAWSDERALDISNVYVEPRFRRQGVARTILTKLVGFGIDRRVEHLVLRVFAANDEAAAFWTAMGFQPRLIQFTASADRLRRQQ